MGKQLLSKCGNRMAMALLLTTDEEAILSKLLLVRRSIGNAKRVAKDVSGNLKNFEVKIKSHKKTQAMHLYLMPSSPSR